MAGRPIAQQNARFAFIPRRTPALYVAEFGNGVVKVGQSGNVRERLLSLERLCRRHGHAITRFEVFCGQREQEQKCIAAISSLREPVEGHCEFFAGVAYPDAIDAVYGVLERKTAKA